MNREKHFDVIIIGSGIAAGTLAHALAENGKRVLVLKEGSHVPDEGPLLLLRLRKKDFGLLRYQDGVSPAWPIAYEDLERFYSEAEHLYAVEGERPMGLDEPFMLQFRAQYLNPVYLPTVQEEAVNDYFDRVFSRSHVTFLTHAEVEKIETDDSGRKIKEVWTNCRGQRSQFTASIVICSAGAVRSAALLLKSADAKNPQGLANSSGLVGKHLMYQNHSAVSAVRFFSKTPAFVERAIGLGDYYLGSINSPIGYSRNQVPAGFIELLRERRQGGWLAVHFLKGLLTTEDLPKPDNSVELVSGGRVRVNYIPNNQAPHRELIYALKRVLKKLGFWTFSAKTFSGGASGEQMGTTVFGRDPSNSVLDIWCRAHDHDNLYVVDGGFFPSSSAVPPALTIAAQALRTAEHIKTCLGIPPEAPQKSTQIVTQNGLR